MKGILAWLSLVLLVLAVPARAGNIQEADYPNQYEVTDASKAGKLQKDCSMTLRDKAKPDVAISVSKTGLASCHLLDKGKVYRGRENEKKNRIEIVIPIGTDKARVEEWQIEAMVTNPK